MLDYAPPYVAGPFGDYYLSTLTALYEAGSQTAGAAGLAQYTVFANQTKDAANSPVTIGLHYVAATNNVPLDSDGDGIPDYMEDANGNGVVDAGETDPNNPMTDGVTNDIYNAVYDNVDLSGDGLVGRIKKALGINPLDPSNPLTATQIVTGEEPDIATFEVPISYDLLTNVGTLHLLVDGGAGGQYQECDRATNGNCLLLWNTTFDSPGQHYLQVQLDLNGQLNQSSTPDQTILAGDGILSSFYSTNICQFDPFYSSFDSGGATLYAKLPESNADYTIELQTLSGAHIKTITNSTTSDEILENWNLTDDQGNTVTDDTIRAVFHVTLADPRSGYLGYLLHRALLVDGYFTVAYTWDNTYYAQGTMRDAIENGVVDPLMSPYESGGGGSANPYNSNFNAYTWSGDLNGNPGYISQEIPDALNLISNLDDVDTMNFYFNGHGSPDTIGDGDRNQVAIGIGAVRSKLGNFFDAHDGAWAQHPYRFAFLDACDTADNDNWAHAFGVYDVITESELANRPSGAQAFVGWLGEPRGPDSDDEWNEIAETYAVFFGAWMNGYDLQQCIDMASSTDPYGDGSVILDFPLGTKFPEYFGVPAQGRANNFTLKIYGYPWLKRTGYDTP